MSPVWVVVLVTVSLGQMVSACDKCDVCIVVDESDSISGGPIFDHVKGFLMTLMDELDIGLTAIRVGLVVFDVDGRVIFDLDDKGNVADVKDGIDGVNPSGEGTKLSAGINTARTGCFNGAATGDRDGVPDVMLFVSDFKSTTGGDNFAAVAQAARNEGIDIIAVGVRNPNVPSMNIVAGSIADNVFYADDTDPAADYTFTTIVPALEDRHMELCNIGIIPADPCDTGATFSISTLTVGGTPTDILTETSTNGDQWIVLVRRLDGCVDFSTPTYSQYEAFFGGLTTEFWMGLLFMNGLTNDGNSYTVRFDLMKWNGNCYYAQYNTFSIGDTTSNYQLAISGYDPASTAGDSMNPGISGRDLNGMKFSSPENGGCASNWKGGWWFNGCGNCKLTGLYGPSVIWFRGPVWFSISTSQSLKYVAIKVKVNP